MPKANKWTDSSELSNLLVQFSRLALTGSSGDLSMLARKTLNSLAKANPELESVVRELLTEAADSPARQVTEHKPPPVDLDSRLELVRWEAGAVIDPEPVWPKETQQALELVKEEQLRRGDLLRHGLTATKSLLLVGPPGVGKTFAARWLASQLGLPLLTLDLAAVMSSFLGRTGNNLRAVLDYARGSQAVLLLDEFDAVAKRRDDPSDVGELKRLVTVILQSVDDWPSGRLLIAATNHHELLDPAVWRRFERVIHFPYPGPSEIVPLLRAMLGDSVGSAVVSALSHGLEGWSFSDIENEIRRHQRSAVVTGTEVESRLLELAGGLIKSQNRDVRARIVEDLAVQGLSQRKIAEVSGLARSTVQSYLSTRDHAQRGAG